MGLLPQAPTGYTLAIAQRYGQEKCALAEYSEVYADVAIDVNIKNLAGRLFTYKVPGHLQSEVFIGSQVLVPFGHQELVSGFVVGLKNEEQKKQGAAAAVSPEKTKPIADVIDNDPLFDRPYIEFLYWISNYYISSISDVLAAAIPADIGPRSKRIVRLLSPGQTGLLDAVLPPPALAKDEQRLVDLLGQADAELSVKTLKTRSQLPANIFYAALTKLRRATIVEVVNQTETGPGPKLINQVIWTGEEGKTERHKEIVACLKRHNGSMPLSELTKTASTTGATIKRMESQGILSVSQVESIRDPLKSLFNSTARNASLPELTAAQESVLKTLLQSLEPYLSGKREQPEAESQSPWLLHGVTGSGKTEIYLRLIAEALKHGRTALLLVPEISLTPQLASRLLNRFGELVAIWHSGLSPGERYDTWRRLQSGELRVLLGARSAILASIPDLSLIILDEEHDGSYKQSSPNPRYSAKHLACERGRREGALVLFGSATPDTATYFEAQKTGKVLELPERVFKQPLPESVLVDMRDAFKSGNHGIFSQMLLEELDECLKRQEQSILLINRRGYANHIFCRSCGHVIKCLNCSVSLVFHSKNSENGQPFTGEGRFTCHHCGFTKAASEICPSCQSPFLRHFGLGTQRVEQEVREMFPEARILRLDSDITARKGAYEEIFRQFAAGEADILIGTQIVAKGIDIAKVTFVGVLAADAAFNLPDYRSLERGFQLLTQVSGRAGRGHHPGKVVLQTFNAELPALNLAREQNFAAFFKSELESREVFGYPPYSQLIRIVLSGPENNAVQMAAEQLAEELSNYLEELMNVESVKLLGPAPCLIERLKGQFRHHILIKNLAGDPGRQAISSFLHARQTKINCRMTIDVDPLDLI